MGTPGDTDSAPCVQAADDGPADGPADGLPPGRHAAGHARHGHARHAARWLPSAAPPGARSTASSRRRSAATAGRGAAAAAAFRARCEAAAHGRGRAGERRRASVHQGASGPRARRSPVCAPLPPCSARHRVPLQPSRLPLLPPFAPPSPLPVPLPLPLTPHPYPFPSPRGLASPRLAAPPLMMDGGRSQLPRRCDGPRIQGPDDRA